MTAINGLTGEVVSWAGYTALLSTLFGEADFVLNETTVPLDSTTFGASAIVAASTIPGLRSATAQISGYFANSVKSGHTGLVTFGDGYVLHARGWNINLTYDVHDVTEFNSTPPTDMSYIAGLARWSGSYTCLLDDSTGISNTTGADGSSGSATFRIFDNTVDDELSGNIVVTGSNSNVLVGGLPGVTYNFVGDGDLAAAGTILGVASTGIWSGGNLVTPSAGSLVLQAFTGRTYTGNAFPSRVSFGCPIGGLATLGVQAQFSGGVTPA